MAKIMIVRNGHEVEHDLRLDSGERQVAAAYGEIRADHRLRYEWADLHIPSATFGLDVFCGNGYGSELLSKTRHVLGIDGSSEAVEFAQDNFRSSNSFFTQAYFPFSLPLRAFDFVVSLESVEHVPDGGAFFRTLAMSLKPRGIIVFSTPCEDNLPFATSGNKFHFRHYTFDETLVLARACKLDIIAWAGQDCYEMSADGRPIRTLAEHQMSLKPREKGQFTIVAARAKP